MTLGFNEPPLRMFPIRGTDTPDGRRNEIVIDFADPGAITVDFLAKEPGAEMRLGAARMVFRYADSFHAANGLEGYERLAALHSTGPRHNAGVPPAPRWVARAPTPPGSGVPKR